MLARALADGLRAATLRPGLVILPWAWNLLLALAAMLPFWGWASGVSGASPDADVMLEGLDMGVLVHMMTNNAAGLAPIFLSAAAVIVLSVLSGAFLAGGILEVLLTADGRRLLPRFFGGAGRYFGRFLRLLLVAGLTTIVVVAMVETLLGAVTGRLTEGGSERASLWAFLASQAVAALTVAFFVLAQDYARVMTVATDARSMMRAWLRGLAFVTRHLPGAALIGILATLAVTATLAAAASYDIAYSGRAWSVILGAILLHQALLIARTAVRVGQVAAQASYFRALRPIPAATAEVIPAEGRQAVVEEDRPAAPAGSAGVPVAPVARRVGEDDDRALRTE